MSDHSLDVEWLLATPDLAHEHAFCLPVSVSDAALWPFLDLPDPPAKRPPPPPAELDRLASSPITTRVDPAPASSESSPPPLRPPLAPIPANPPTAPAPRPRRPSAPQLAKTIVKPRNPPGLDLHHPRVHVPAKLKTPPRRKPSPKRAPRRAKVEAPLLADPPLDQPALSKSPAALKRTPDDSRERHNQMMRENRHRFNNKFKELTALLDTFKQPGCEYKPMKNKIQILERAIYQYVQMQTNRARFESELMFAPENPESVNSDFLKVFIAVPSLPDACNLLIQNMCSTMNWKYGEAWVRNPTHQYQLYTSVVSQNNMPDTRHALRKFSQTSKANPMDDYLLTLSNHRNAVWIPNLSTKSANSSRAAAAKAAGITTMFTVPIYLSDDPDALPDAIITLMHANDDLLSFARDERPYDSQSMTKLLDLTAAVVKSRAKIAC